MTITFAPTRKKNKDELQIRKAFNGNLISKKRRGEKRFKRTNDCLYEELALYKQDKPDPTTTVHQFITQSLKHHPSLLPQAHCHVISLPLQLHGSRASYCIFVGLVNRMWLNHMITLIYIRIVVLSPHIIQIW